MTLALLTMSQDEIDRADWTLRIRERRVTQAQVAAHLALSVTQVERMYRAYKAGGAAALVSKKRGRPSLRRLPDRLRTTALGLVRSLYGDFRRTLAREKLEEFHGVTVSVETLRQWMIDRLWVPRAAHRARPHPPRYRRPCLGELVQIDGCDHVRIPAYLSGRSNRIRRVIHRHAHEHCAARRAASRYRRSRLPSQRKRRFGVDVATALRNTRHGSGMPGMCPGTTRRPGLERPSLPSM